jgi:hypothetical protein
MESTKDKGVSHPKGKRDKYVISSDYEHLRQPEDVSPRSWSCLARSKAIFSGWRTGILWCIIAAVAVFLVNFALIIWSTKRSKSSSGNRILFQGGCESTRWIATVAHLLINALSTLLLAASNYCMQVLASPTRADIDRLHAQHRTAQIGTNSFGNVLKLGWPRRIMWCLLGMSSLPVHLM